MQGRLSEKSDDFPKSTHEGVDVIFGIVQGEGGSRRRGDLIEIHDRHCAVMTGPNGDTQLIKKRADIVGMNAVQGKGQDGTLVCRGSDDSKSGNLLCFLGGIVQKGFFVSGDGIDTQAVDIVDCSAQSNRIRNARCSGFKFVRKVVV